VPRCVSSIIGRVRPLAPARHHNLACFGWDKSGRAQRGPRSCATEAFLDLPRSSSATHEYNGPCGLILTASSGTLEKKESSRGNALVQPVADARLLRKHSLHRTACLAAMPLRTFQRMLVGNGSTALETGGHNPNLSGCRSLTGFFVAPPSVVDVMHCTVAHVVRVQRHLLEKHLWLLM
jgi:hypothetical protein